MHVGIDIGSSTTKIVVMDNYKIIDKYRIPRDESLDDILDLIDLSQVDKIMLTGTGASYLEGDIKGIKTEYYEEFQAVALGGYYLSGMEECLVASLGTGTSFVYVNRERRDHIGGTGIGGALLASMARNGLGMEDVREFLRLAEKGDLNNTDLLIKDISKNAVGDLIGDVTVANMSKITKDSTPEDYAFGVCNLVFQNVGVMAVMADKMFNTKKVVVMGSIADSKIASRCFDAVAKLFGYEFIMPQDNAYGVAIGAILLGDEKYENYLYIAGMPADEVDYDFE